MAAASVPWVVNGFDEHAVEAALRIKDAQEARVTILSAGTSFVTEVMRKPLAMGADDLALLQDSLFQNTPDSAATAAVLAAGVRKLGVLDLVLCGRQASDWDNAQTPLLLAEMLGLPCVTLARKVDVHDGRLRVERVTPDGYQVVEAPLPALVTVSNELGQPRYPTLRGIMGAGRKPTVVWNAADLGLDRTALSARVELLDLAQPHRQTRCELV
ncbi:MAG: electron transfer flavoprotein subunit beta/FixA family protein, partial [Chloroflexota bacterium]|nr:electron transfer flavoprotein subunit beta/FixA family protein [Chloroflexota bacterium]